jgi:hypothetical protein
MKLYWNVFKKDQGVCETLMQIQADTRIEAGVLADQLCKSVIYGVFVQPAIGVVSQSLDGLWFSWDQHTNASITGGYPTAAQARIAQCRVERGEKPADTGVELEITKGMFRQKHFRRRPSGNSRDV